MTRKDYILIANAIQTTRNSVCGEADYAVVDAVSKELAFVLKQDNPRFDRALFMAACGVKGG